MHERDVAYHYTHGKGDQQYRLQFEFNGQDDQQQSYQDHDAIIPIEV